MRKPVQASMAAGRLRDVGVTLCEGPTPQAFRAVVGALFTAGIRPAEIGSLAHTVRWTRLVHASMNRRVLLDSTGLAAFLHDALGGGGFYAMQRRFAVVACELTTGEQALPLLHALIAAAEARRDWQQAASGSPVTPRGEPLCGGLHHRMLPGSGRGRVIRYRRGGRLPA
jgi:hypothetical protein